MGRVHEVAHFELVKLEAQHPVPGGASEAAEPVPTSQGLAAVLTGHLGGRHVHIDVHRLVAVVLEGVGCIAT